MNTLSIGTISSGTLRPEDLLPVLADALEDKLAFDAPANLRVRIYEARDIAALCDAGNPAPEDVEKARDIEDELMSILQDYAPAALLVNDHGNVMLFLHDGDRWEEIWSIV